MMSDDHPHVERLADEWDARCDCLTDDTARICTCDAEEQLRAAIEADRAAGHFDHPHDDRCESEYESGAHAWTPCGCWASRSEMEGLVAECKREADRRDELRAEVERLRGEREAAAEQFDAECEYTATLRAEVERLRDELAAHRTKISNRDYVAQREAAARRDTAEQIAQAIGAVYSRRACDDGEGDSYDEGYLDALDRAEQLALECGQVAREHGEEES